MPHLARGVFSSGRLLADDSAFDLRGCNLSLVESGCPVLDTHDDSRQLGWGD